MSGTLVVRLDSLGDVLISGPAVRAVAAASPSTTMLVGPGGADAARLLPGVDDILVWDCPWISAAPGPIEQADIATIIAELSRREFDRAVVLTSFHQSALPTALLLRLAGVPHIAAVSEDYPGMLLDVRLPEPADAPEPVRMLAIARGAGFDLEDGDDGRLRLRDPLPPMDVGVADYVVIHPGASASARSYPAVLWHSVVRQLTASGRHVVVTGGKDETALTAEVAAHAAHDWGGRLSVAELAAVLRGARAVAVANTGPAHLAAAVGTPVVSLFAPVVPMRRWAPFGVPIRVLGDLDAPCRDTRAVTCRVPGHPCLSGISPDLVVEAVCELAGWS